MTASTALAAFLWTAPVLAPVVLAVLVATPVGRRPWLVVVAPLPALVLALTGPLGAAPDLAWVLLDVRMGLPPWGRVVLAAVALVWLAGGVAARSMLAGRGGATALWLVALAGNVGVVLAADVVTLYAAYATMTFAAYGLVVHDGTAFARRAGRVYVALAVMGEALLLTGLVAAVGLAGGPDLDLVVAGIAAAPQRELIAGLLIAAFAVKAGILPVHGWLPLAHPAAPIPASAVLSGAMIKAGPIGWLRLLPLGDAGMAGWGTALLVVGVVTALAAAVIGILQTQAKVVLAYSSVSQMGLIATVVGVGLAVPEAAPVAVAAAATSVLHHAAAKAALFLGVGVPELGPRWRRPALAGAVVAGAALAGVPLTSGWLAKEAAKGAVGALADPWSGRVAFTLSVVAVGTTVLMARLVLLLRRSGQAGSAPAAGGGAPGPGGRWLLLGWLGALVAALTAAWVLPVWLLDEVTVPAFGVGRILDGLWPVAVGVALAVLAVGVLRRQPMDRRPAWLAALAGADDRPVVPPGDIAVVGEAAAARVRSTLAGVVRWLGVVDRRLRRAATGLARLPRRGVLFAVFDRALTRWQVAGVMFVVVAAALIVTLTRAAG